MDYLNYWMSRKKITTRCTRIAITSIVVSLLTIVTCAQDVTGPALKAAFIYNLAKFTEWPAETAMKPFAMCVIGDGAVADALERAVKNRTLAGNSISVMRLPTAAPARACHLLYVSGVTTAQAAQVIAGLQNSAVLTMSDMEGFTESGGISQLFFENGQLRFSIRMESVKRSGLHISANVLTLAVRK